MPTDSTVNIKILPYNTRGTTADVTLATTLTLTTRSRYLRPYPPGNFRIGANALGVRPATVVGDLVLNWNARNRLTQAQMIRQDAADVPGGGETGQTYKAVIFIAGVLIRTVLLGAAGTFTYTSAQRGIDDPNYEKLVTVQIFSNANGLDSFYPATVTIQMIGVTGILAAARYEFTATQVGGLFI